MDDEKLIRWLLVESLIANNYEVLSADTGTKALELAGEEIPDLVMLDINLPDIDGIETLERLKQINRDGPVIMMTAYGTVETAIKTMKLGAYDYINKPFNMDEVILRVKNAMETGKLKKEVSLFRAKEEKMYALDNLIGEDESTIKVLEMIKKIAKDEATTVLIEGENGTGKSLIAKIIHYQGPGGHDPFIELNCTAFPDTLIDRELFGYETLSEKAADKIDDRNGERSLTAFTDTKRFEKGLFELAGSGTVLLNEIGSIHLSAQARLLRVIEEKSLKRTGGTRDIEVDVRIIAATNKNLEEEVKKGRFREDLYYRLKVVSLYLPPLRERKKDILLLAGHFTKDFNKELKKNITGISPEAEELLSRYNWPGNIRELRNAIERAIILENKNNILAEHLPLEIVNRNTPGTKDAKASFFNLPPDGISIKEVEKDLIKQALEMMQNNQIRAAKLLHISRDTLRYRMKKFNLL
ncbi:MAG: sigma-54-dependent transcriptional regulator [Nitrospinota bacterium]